MGKVGRCYPDEASDLGFFQFESWGFFFNPQNKVIYIRPQFIITVIFVEESG